MTISKLEFLDLTQLDHKTLEIWIEEEWLVPSGTLTEQVFSEADLARVKLIQDLTQDLGVNEEGVSVILNLLDQVHGLRKVLADILQSTRKQSGAHVLTPERSPDTWRR